MAGVFRRSWSGYYSRRRAAPTVAAGADLAFTATQGVIHVTGQNASVNTSRIVTAQRGVLHLTGQDATVALGADLAFSATQGVLHLTGQNSTVSASRNVLATQGVLHVTGQDASVNASRKVIATQGVIHLTGQDATVALGSALAFDASQGVLYVTGQNASVSTSRIVLASQGVLYLTGRNATIGAEEEETAAGGGPGGKKRRRTNRYPRWILIDGKRIRVQSAEEERRLLAAYQQRLEREKAALEAADAPQAEIAPLRIKAARTERRIDEVDDREAEWKAKLRRIDSELVLLLG